MERPGSYREVEEGLSKARVRAVLVIPPGFARDLAPGGSVPVQLLLDGSDANTATIAQNYAGAIVARHSTQVLLQGRPMPAVAGAETRIWYNETLESRNMIVPGLVAVIMSIIAAMLTSLTIAREWERGTMEQLASTPVRGVEIVLGKLLPYLLIGFFDVHRGGGRGDPGLRRPLQREYPSSWRASPSSSCWVLWAWGSSSHRWPTPRSSPCRRPWSPPTFRPFSFPASSSTSPECPLFLQGVTFLIPARYFVVVTRGILLKGVGVEALWPQAVAMLVFAIVGLTLATKVFKKEIKA